MSDEVLKVVTPAAISFFAAVVAVVVGQLLGQRFQREADERKWHRDDQARRRVQGEGPAREVRKELLAAADLLSNEAGAERAGAVNRWVPPDHADLRPHTAKARELATEIPDRSVREFVKSASYALEQCDMSEEWGGPDPTVLSHQIAGEVDAVTGAYIWGEPIPRHPWSRPLLRRSTATGR